MPIALLLPADKPPHLSEPATHPPIRDEDAAPIWPAPPPLPCGSERRVPRKSSACVPPQPVLLDRRPPTGFLSLRTPQLTEALQLASATASVSSGSMRTALPSRPLRRYAPYRLPLRRYPVCPARRERHAYRLVRKPRRRPHQRCRRRRSPRRRIQRSRSVTR